jgi:molybdate transport system substrate-binding protein
MYTAGVTTGAAHAGEAHTLIKLLTSAEAREERARAGFL